MRHLLTILIAGGLLLGCGAEFDPFHLANKFRVLTIKTDPPEIVLDPALLGGGAPMGPVTLPPTIEMTALHPPAPEGTTWTWDVCLFSLGSLTAYECISPELEVRLDADDDVATLDLIQVFLALGSIGGEMPDDGDEVPMLGACPPFLALPDGSCLSRFDLQVKVTAGPPGEKIVAVRQIPVWFDAERVPNTNPDVTALVVEGTPTRGGEVTLRAEFDDASLETFIDPDGDQATELPVFSWFTTDGVLSPGATFDDDRETVLTLPDDPAVETVEVFVVVRDGDARRGIDFETATITLTD